ncbi:hypothetical protein KW892_27605, partial [Klebsiella pneumoniae]|uniref:hypothetical protein n=1 Tax=Klebsiella pneumoniae TaxID=573 RepID=UPI001F05C31E
MRETPNVRAMCRMEWPCRARTLISTVCSWVNIDGLEKAAKLAQVDQFYFAGVGQFYTAANTEPLKIPSLQ